MSTVRQLVQDLADGRVTLAQVQQDFTTRRWAVRQPTDAQRYGVQDLPMPPPNSFDWVDMTVGLTEVQREALRAAYDEAVSTG